LETIRSYPSKENMNYMDRKTNFTMHKVWPSATIDSRK
jgi:hypothetical protein